MRSSSSRALRRVGLAALALVVLSASAAAPADARGRPSGSRAIVLVEGLSSPKGLTAGFGVVPVVAQGAFGPPGPIVAALGQRTFPLSDPVGAVDVAYARDGSLWVLESNGVLSRLTWHGGLQQVADLIAYQAVDIDPDTTDGNPTESNPYGLAALPNGDALVADAAGNDVLRVDRKGTIRTVARFKPELVATDHIPDFPGPPALPAESVPTSIAVTRHGIYVGELKGFPFRPGSSNVYKLPLDALGATCSADAPSASCRVVQEDLTAIQDLTVDPITGKMYVYELAADGTLAFEAGFETGEFPPAVLLEISGSRRRELAAGQLSQPGGVIAAFGVVHVTDGTFGNGRLLRITR